MDDTDLRILRVLQEDSSLSVSDVVYICSDGRRLTAQGKSKVRDTFVTVYAIDSQHRKFFLCAEKGWKRLADHKYAN